MPALLRVPLPLDLRQSGWGRSLHFLAAWITVVNGLVYVGSGLILGHFRTRMALRGEAGRKDPSYTPVQKAAYLAVIFLALPLLILTGLTMSPAVTAAYPPLTSLFAGRQSARTLHFFGTLFLLGFLVVHLVQIARHGFGPRLRAMLGGNPR